MADRLDRQPGQPEGTMYVDSQCIDCDLCRQTAPDNFTRDEEGGYSYVFKQPDNKEELQACLEARDGCPVDAIGNDGTGVEISSVEELSTATDL